MMFVKFYADFLGFHDPIGARFFLNWVGCNHVDSTTTNHKTNDFCSPETGGELGPTQTCLYETHQASDWGDLPWKKKGSIGPLKK